MRLGKFPNRENIDERKNERYGKKKPYWNSGRVSIFIILSMYFGSAYFLIENAGKSYVDKHCSYNDLAKCQCIANSVTSEYSILTFWPDKIFRSEQKEREREQNMENNWKKNCF